MKLPGEKPLGFHVNNLEVAEISDEAWEQLSTLPEIQSWSDEINLETTTPEAAEQINSLTLNVTQICNLHCTYCAAGGDGTYNDPVKNISIEKTIPQIEFFLNKISANNRFHIAFLGGEPLLYPQALEAIAQFASHKASEKHIQLSMKVTTNGTLLTQEIVQMLGKNKISVVISVDGPAEINDRQRPSKSGKSTTVKIEDGIRLLNEFGSGIPRITLHGVFNEQNMNVKKAWEYYETLNGIDDYEFTYSVTTHNPEANFNFMAEMKEIAGLAWARGGEKRLRKIATFDRMFFRLDNQTRVTNYCGIRKNLAVIDSKNRIYDCPWTVGMANHQIGDQANIQTEKLSNQAANLVTKNNCESCWSKYLCGGGCSFIHNSIHGDINRKNNDFCDRTRLINALAIGYYQKARATT